MTKENQEQQPDFVAELMQKQKEGKLKPSEFKNSQAKKNSSANPLNMPNQWKDLHLDFTYHGWDWETNYQAQWEQQGFNYLTTKEWIDIGMKPSDAEYAYWLAQVLKLAPLTVLNEGNEADLREQFAKWKAEPRPVPVMTKQLPFLATKPIKNQLNTPLAFSTKPQASSSTFANWLVKHWKFWLVIGGISLAGYWWLKEE